MGKEELQYYVRKNWDDVASQVGIPYNFLINAKKACDKLDDYYVFDSNGILVYPEIKKEILPKVEEKKMFNVGDEVRLIPGATFISGKEIKSGWFNTKLFVSDIEDNQITISNAKRGPIIGIVSNQMLIDYDDNSFIASNSYVVIVNNNTDIHNGAGKNHKIIGQAKNIIYILLLKKKTVGVNYKKALVGLN